MFRLSRFLSLASGIAVLLMTILLSWAYHRSEIAERTESAGLRNEALARTFANAIWPEMGEALVRSQGLGGDVLRERPLARELDRRIRRLSADVPIVKIKVYSLDGVAVYSSLPREIGEDKRTNPGFLAARGGERRSELVRGGSMSATEGEIENVDVVASYVPIRTETGGPVRAVFELHTDVTADIAAIERRAAALLLGLGASFGVLYAVLLLIAGRAVRILSRQHAAIRDNEASIRAKNLELEAANERMRMVSAVFDRSIQGIVVTDSDRNIVEVNRAYTEITGHRADESIGHPPQLMSSGWHDDAFYDAIWETARRDGHWQGEVTNRRKNGEIYSHWLMLCADYNARNEVVHYIGMFYDITEKRLSEERIARLAYYDTLTELANRGLFEDRLEHALQFARRNQSSLAVMFIDLDRFKPVNDSLGHKAGDMLLKQVAGRLSGIVRDSDTIARLGGDEFALLIAGGFPDSRQYVSDVAQRLLDALAEPFWIDGHEIFAGASIGISLYPLDGDAPETLLKHADVAMYQAKHAGRNRYRFFVPAMNAGALERLGIEESLRHALDRNEFELYFLPTVSTATGRLTGTEVLMRWRHPERGLLLPGAFVTIAEETGLIVPIGAWLLEEACRAFARWRPRLPPGFRIAVNLSARQLQGDLVETVRRALALTGIDPSGIELELTERMLMVDTERAIEMMDGLAALGVRLSLDDFGTGYSSLAYLKRFPLDKLKIDRSFVADLPDDRSGIAIVEATLALAHSLGLTVIAEGVETDAQFAFLRRAGCAECQGYLFSPPVPADRFADFLDAGPLPGTRPVPEHVGTARGDRVD